jgi:hypothetical protein
VVFVGKLIESIIHVSYAISLYVKRIKRQTIGKDSTPAPDPSTLRSRAVAVGPHWVANAPSLLLGKAHVARRLRISSKLWWAMMSTHAFVFVDSVGSPSAEVCRAAASFP